MNRVIRKPAPLKVSRKSPHRNGVMPIDLSCLCFEEPPGEVGFDGNVHLLKAALQEFFLNPLRPKFLQEEPSRHRFERKAVRDPEPDEGAVINPMLLPEEVDRFLTDGRFESLFPQAYAKFLLAPGTETQKPVRRLQSLLQFRGDGATPPFPSAPCSRGGCESDNRSGRSQ